MCYFGESVVSPLPVSCSGARPDCDFLRQFCHLSGDPVVSSLEEQLLKASGGVCFSSALVTFLVPLSDLLFLPAATASHRLNLSYFFLWDVFDVFVKAASPSFTIFMNSFPFICTKKAFIKIRLTSKIQWFDFCEQTLILPVWTNRSNYVCSVDLSWQSWPLKKTPTVSN